MSKQIVGSSIWLSEHHPNYAYSRQVVSAIEKLFKEVGNKKILWDTFKVQSETISSNFPEGIAAGLLFSVIVEDSSEPDTR